MYSTRKSRMPAFRQSKLFEAATNPMTQAMLRIFLARQEKEKAALAEAVEFAKSNPRPCTYKPPAMPHGLPAPLPTWRANFANLGDVIAQSPLETRQQRRDTGRRIARLMASHGRALARHERRHAA